ncbi:MAG: T9SS type A sorting domain-containing protein [Bacteroidales bacterium]|nr:T9SS type A sorting domain-containing protein [Bacteroidales bacterium]
MEEVCDNITITVSSANENMGTVSGGGEYEFGAQVTITATPNQGYRFVRWTDGNTNNPRTITATANATYIATFEEGVGIENIDILDNLTFYPNPTKGILNFSMEVEKIEVMDMMGKMVMQFCNVNEINIASLPKGVYCLRLSYNGKIIVHKIIKE